MPTKTEIKRRISAILAEAVSGYHAETHKLSKYRWGHTCGPIRWKEVNHDIHAVIDELFSEPSAPVGRAVPGEPSAPPVVAARRAASASATPAREIELVCGPNKITVKPNIPSSVRGLGGELIVP